MSTNFFLRVLPILMILALETAKAFPEGNTSKIASQDSYTPPSQQINVDAPVTKKAKCLNKGIKLNFGGITKVFRLLEDDNCEDEKEMRSTLRYKLQAVGYTVRQANRGSGQNPSKVWMNIEKSNTRIWKLVVLVEENPEISIDVDKKWKNISRLNIISI